MDHLRLGVLTQPFGREGALRCHPDSDGISKVLVPCQVWIGYSESFSEPMRLIGCKPHGRDLICILEGVETREDAEKLGDRAIFLEHESVRYADLYSDPIVVGYGVFDESGNEFGTVGSLFRTQAHAVWRIRREGRPETMIPAVEQFVRKIDHAGRRVIIRPIPGMFDELDVDKYDG